MPACGTSHIVWVAFGGTIWHTYTYDGLNRLVSASGHYQKTERNGLGLNNPPPQKYERAYGYAHNGNLTRKDILDPDSHALVDRWSYVYANHAAGAINTTVYGSDRFVMYYDAAGNMIHQADNAAGRVRGCQVPIMIGTCFMPPCRGMPCISASRSRKMCTPLKKPITS